MSDLEQILLRHAREREALATRERAELERALGVANDAEAVAPLSAPRKPPKQKPTRRRLSSYAPSARELRSAGVDEVTAAEARRDLGKAANR